MTFEQYYTVWRAGRRGENLVGLDDGAVDPGPSTDKQLITRPTGNSGESSGRWCCWSTSPTGRTTRTTAPATTTAMLFSQDEFPTGSMREFYRDVSGFGTAPAPASTSRARCTAGSGCRSRCPSTPTATPA